jgi:hypothetical protein
MEREKEIARLVSVLRQTARMAMQSEWTGGAQDAATYCADQYNRVLNRLKELEPDMATVFAPLPAGCSLTVAAMACRQLAAYYDEEAGRGRPHWGGRAHAFRFDGSTLKEIWRESAQEIEDFGEFIRENVEEWARRRRHHDCGARRREARPEPPPPPEPPRPPEPPPPPRPPDEY